MKMRTAGWVAGLVLGAVGAAAAQDQGQVEAGRKVFAAQKCSICHSIAGQGNKNGSLDGVGSKLSADEIRQWIANAPEMAAKTNAQRKPVMKVFMLPKTELDSLVGYLQSLKK
jgi:mono/diheme cytochrome c family protein